MSSGVGSASLMPVVTPDASTAGAGVGGVGVPPAGGPGRGGERGRRPRPGSAGLRRPGREPADRRRPTDGRVCERPVRPGGPDRTCGRPDQADLHEGRPAKHRRQRRRLRDGHGPGRRPVDPRHRPDFPARGRDGRGHAHRAATPQRDGPRGRTRRAGSGRLRTARRRRHGRGRRERHLRERARRADAVRRRPGADRAAGHRRRARHRHRHRAGRVGVPNGSPSCSRAHGDPGPGPGDHGHAAHRCRANGSGHDADRPGHASRVPRNGPGVVAAAGRRARHARGRHAARHHISADGTGDDARARHDGRRDRRRPAAGVGRPRHADRSAGAGPRRRRGLAAHQHGGHGWPRLRRGRR